MSLRVRQVEGEAAGPDLDVAVKIARREEMAGGLGESCGRGALGLGRGNLASSLRDQERTWLHLMWEDFASGRPELEVPIHLVERSRGQVHRA